MPDDQGSLLILGKTLDLLDELNYTEEMHHPLLDSPEGVSLERISYELPSSLPANWHSASSTEGFATPGRENSQRRELPGTGRGFEIEPEVFTPDGDGDRDMVLIRYSFESGGGVASVLVLDAKGRLISRVAGNQLLGSSGMFAWNGTDRYGRRARTGLYLIRAEVHFPGGAIQRFSKTCVLSVNP
jgi:hypothetical protein